MKKSALLTWTKQHLFELRITLRICGSLLGLVLGIIIAESEDAPGAVLIFGGFAFLGSGLISCIGLGMSKLLLDIEGKLK